MKTTQLERLIQVLRDIESRHFSTVSHLSQVLGCSRRTIFRDIRQLREAGMPIQYTASFGGYAISSSKKLCNVQMTEEELLSMVLAVSLSPLAKNSQFSEAVSSAIAKLIHNASESNSNYFVRLVKSLIVTDDSDPIMGVCDSPLRSVISSICNRQQLRINYRLTKLDKLLCTKLSPYIILASRNQLRLVARSSYHRRTLLLDISRICESIETMDKYEVPAQYLRAGTLGSKNYDVPYMIAKLKDIEDIEDQNAYYQNLA